MIVALDASPLSVPTGGIRRYTEELSLGLAKEYPADTYYLLSDQLFDGGCARLPNLHARQPSPGTTRHWWSTGLPRLQRTLGTNLFHGTDFSVPYRWTPPSVITVHDLSPWRDGDWRRHPRIVRRTPWLLRLGMAASVITPTEAIRREVVNRFGVDEQRVYAIPLAAAAVFRPCAAQTTDETYFLVVGTIEPRKNLAAVIDAWRWVRKTAAVELWIAGRLREDGVAPPAENGLRWLGIVDDETLARLYSSALAVLMPSQYEGFGLPVIEAMQCGAPVIASRDGALREVAGGAALHVEMDWAEAMRCLASDSELRNRLRAASLRRAELFSWNATARATRAVYVETLQRNG